MHFLPSKMNKYLNDTENESTIPWPRTMPFHFRVSTHPIRYLGDTISNGRTDNQSTEVFVVFLHEPEEFHQDIMSMLR